MIRESEVSKKESAETRLRELLARILLLLKDNPPEPRQYEQCLVSELHRLLSKYASDTWEPFEMGIKDMVGRTTNTVLDRDTPRSNVLDGILFSTATIAQGGLVLLDEDHKKCLKAFLNHLFNLLGSGKRPSLEYFNDDEEDEDCPRSFIT